MYSYHYGRSYRTSNSLRIKPLPDVFAWVNPVFLPIFIETHSKFKHTSRFGSRVTLTPADPSTQDRTSKVTDAPK